MLVLRKITIFAPYNMDKHILDNTKQTLLLHLPQKAEAILYGSQARGDERPDSDWDILVIRCSVALDANRPRKPLPRNKQITFYGLFRFPEFQ